ncbi:hypothetical protein ATCC90586_004771 [Pythium insidiosum]|nr:hypothetical protein ATCC90586_004771 [Pythium insidiosum]
MYHVAEIVRDAKRAMDERYEGGGVSPWVAYTPLPFLYALSGQISQTMQRKAPDLVKRAAVRTRDCVADAVLQCRDWRLGTTRRGQLLFYAIKARVEHSELPPALAPIRAHVAVPALHGVEGLARFVTSEELPELYFVAKTSMTRHVLLRTFVLPPLSAVEGLVRYLVILPTQVVFPSREEIESRTDLFLDMSTSQLQTLVEYIYSATEVLDQHWSMVQWNILGRGPYESLSIERRRDVMRSIVQRMRIIESRFKLFEFMATIKLQNEMLYADLRDAYPLSGGVPLDDDEIAANAALRHELDEQNQHSFPCWFYRKTELTPPTVLSATPADQQQTTTASTSSSSSSSSSSSKAKWIEFPPHENRRLERHFRFYHRQKTLRRLPLPSPIVLVDEGRHEVNMETMEMTPVYWTAVEKLEVRRSMWLYAQRNYGLAPYNPTAAAVLEQAFTYYLAFQDDERQRLRRAGARESSRSKRQATCSLSVPVEGHLVEFKGPLDIMQYKRLLAGTTPFTSKRRVYRGDPRVRGDPKTLETWKLAMASADKQPSTGTSLPANEDDADIEADVDHLVLIVHGIGDALKTIDLINVVTLRSIIDCATSLRTLHREALRSAHFERLGEKHPRVEFLPIEWHSKLHIAGLDNAIRDVTLPAIPKLREFANDTVLDVLFFMSPMFHRVILEHVANEMNRVVSLFQDRNKGWRRRVDGRVPRRKKVSIIAHSLGAIISFDVLNHQVVPPPVPRGTATKWPNADLHEEEEEEESDNEEEDGDDYSGDRLHDESCDDSRGFEALIVEQLQQRSRSDSECMHSRASRKPVSVKLPQRTRAKPKTSPPPTTSSPSAVSTTKRSRSRASHSPSIHNHLHPLAPFRNTTRRRSSRSSDAATTSPRPTPKRARPRRRGLRRHAHESSTCAQSPAPPSAVPQLVFDVENLFCFGSPVGLFLNVRGQHIDRDFRLPTCLRLFNIYHPYDPVAYRIEPILNPRRAHSKAAIIRTFEGKLRFQYQIRNSFRRMWQKLRHWRRNFETQVECAVRSIGLVETATPLLGYDSTASAPGVSAAAAAPTSTTEPEHSSARQRGAMLLLPTDREDEGDHVDNYEVYGRLCQGLPIDYSLQENEIEITNEYLFALTAHVIYWGNRDASLFVAQKMILEPPEHQDGDDDDDEDDRDGWGVESELSAAEITGDACTGSISSAFSSPGVDW